MLSTLLSVESVPFDKPNMDYYALAPELILVGTIVVLALLDSIKLDRARAAMPAVASPTR